MTPAARDATTPFTPTGGKARSPAAVAVTPSCRDELLGRR